MKAGLQHQAESLLHLPLQLPLRNLIKGEHWLVLAGFQINVYKSEIYVQITVTILGAVVVD